MPVMAAAGKISEKPGSPPEDVGTSEVSDSAAACVLYCPESGEILYGHDINQRRPIASITKIMTALIALEEAGKCDKQVRITPQMYAEGSSMYLHEGEVLLLSEIVKGMLAVSGNDAANAAAYAVAGSKEKFAELMNQRAQKLGMKNSHFVTPSGLDSKEHYSSAYDMALLCAEAMNNSRFLEIVSRRTIEASYISPSGKVQELTNHNRLLSMCEGCVGIKTGYTLLAGRTLTSCAERDGIRLIAVTLDDRNDWEDHIALYDYGFSELERVKPCTYGTGISIPVAGTDGESAYVVPEKEISFVIRKKDSERVRKSVCIPPFIFPPIKTGEIIGRADYYLDDRRIASVRLKLS